MTSVDPLVWISAILAVIGGLAAIFRPMAQQIEALLKGEARARETEKKVGEIEVRFAGIETQFRNLDERTLRMESAFNDKLKATDEKVQMEYKAAEDRLSGLADVATHGIATMSEEVSELRDKVQDNAIAIAAGRRAQGGK